MLIRLKVSSVLVLLTIYLTTVSSNWSGNDELFQVGQDWADVGKFYAEFAWPHRSRLLDYIDLTTGGHNDDGGQLSTACNKSLQLLAAGLRRQVDWAIESTF